jgi:hypothetical protein
MLDQLLKGSISDCVLKYLEWWRYRRNLFPILDRMFSHSVHLQVPDLAQMIADYVICRTEEEEFCKLAEVVIVPEKINFCLLRLKISFLWNGRHCADSLRQEEGY